MSCEFSSYKVHFWIMHCYGLMSGRGFVQRRHKNLSKDTGFAELKKIVSKIYSSSLNYSTNFASSFQTLCCFAFCLIQNKISVFCTNVLPILHCHRLNKSKRVVFLAVCFCFLFVRNDDSFFICVQLHQPCIWSRKTQKFEKSCVHAFVFVFLQKKSEDRGESRRLQTQVIMLLMSQILQQSVMCCC